MNRLIKFTASETEITRPFKIADGFFENVSIKTQEHLDFSKSERHYQSPENKLDFLKINFILEKLDNYDIKISDDNLQIFVVFKDKNIKSNFPIGQFSLTEINGNVLDFKDKIPYNLDESNFEITLLLIEKNKFHILSQKKFLFTKLVEITEIPRIWMPESFFVEKGLSKKTLWYVNWIGTDFDKNLNELVNICLNKNYEININKLNDDAKNKSFKIQMGASILTDIIYPILKNKSENVTDNSNTVQTIKDFLINNCNFSNDSLDDLIKSEFFHSTLSASIINYLNLEQELLKLDE